MNTNQENRRIRTRVGAAFQRMAAGVRRKRAYAATVAFYRATGHRWTKAFA